MTVEMPAESSYYYECSYGNIRLIYHIPFSILEELVSDRKIDKKVLKDYPDGADINCTVGEYDVFEAAYQFRPPAEPEQLRRALIALFTPMELGVKWDEFRGSGDIKASELEKMGGVVNDSLRSRDSKLVEEHILKDGYSYEELREVRFQQFTQQAAVDQTLQEISFDLVTQEFATDIPPTRKSLLPEMDDGDSPEEIFARAQKK